MPLFRPAVTLMRRLSFLPKLGIVALLFALPAFLVTGLFIQQANQAIALSMQERVGVQQLRQLHQLISLAQQMRGLRRLALAGNAQANQAAQQNAEQKQQEFAQIFAAFKESMQREFPTESLKMVEVTRTWQVLVTNAATSRSRACYLEHSALLEQLGNANRRLADVSHLSLDPSVETHYLIDLLVKKLPELADELSDIGARGASYIDTGLLEANEDVLISSNVMLAKRDIERISGTFQISLNNLSQQLEMLQGYQDVLAGNRQFLERTKNEVLNSVNQTSGTAYLQATHQNTLAVFALAAKVSQHIETALDTWISQYQQRRNLMLAAVISAFCIAGYLLGGFYLAMATETSELADAVSDIAGGKLNGRIYSHGQDEIAKLLNAFDAMRVDLMHLVQNIRHGSESMGHAAQEIAHGNIDLSHRTEQQASSLAETSASMAALTEAVKQNADGADHAAQYALSASEVAQQGGQVVRAVIQTMEGIALSSTKISEIIGVIDGIAFQTNILALNAAVEAARAGEEGRGFAVVAGEVRNLAQRSASAAKEIKQLITHSVEQVNAGSAQVHNAGKTMQQIVDSITKVSATMHEITDASAVQSNSILQMNEALRQIDNITQQNAALVEEVAAAAQSMHQQAQELTKLVAVFKI